MIVHPGTLPIILSAPHGGRKPVPGVPLRVGNGIDKFVTVRDDLTDELALKTAAGWRRPCGKPWVVVAQFERKYLDANRPADQSYETPAAKPFYDTYHGRLEAACKAVKDKFGRGLLLDIHGQVGRPDAICRGTQNGKTVTAAEGAVRVGRGGRAGQRAGAAGRRRPRRLPGHRRPAGRPRGRPVQRRVHRGALRAATPGTPSTPSNWSSAARSGRGRPSAERRPT